MNAGQGGLIIVICYLITIHLLVLVFPKTRVGRFLGYLAAEHVVLWLLICLAVGFYSVDVAHYVFGLPLAAK